MPDPALQLFEVIDGPRSYPLGNTTGLSLWRLSGDNARRFEYYRKDYSEPEESEFGIIVSHLDFTWDDKMIGCVVLPGTYTGVRSAEEVLTGRYLPYPVTNSAGNATIGFIQKEPVNAIPYLLRMWEHISKIAYEFVSNSHQDLFPLLYREDGVSPTDISHTVREKQAFEIASVVVRTLVGLVWGKTIRYYHGSIFPTRNDSWKAETAPLELLVKRLCVNCRGRGWKIRFLEEMDVLAWEKAIVNWPQGRIQLPRSSFYHLIPGEESIDEVTGLTNEDRRNWLQNWRRALSYHRTTTGDEANIYQDAPLPTVPTA